MSRMALALIPTFVPISAAVGQEASGPVTAEQALVHYRQVFKTTRELDCPASDDPDEIVVCGRQRGAADPNRAPLPIGPEPGARIAGELPTGLASMSADRCLRICHQPIKVDVVKAARFMRSLAERLIEGD